MKSAGIGIRSKLSSPLTNSRGTKTSFERNQEALKRQNEKYEKAKERFYPSVPSPPLPATLPLQNYTGIYSHPAYHNINLVFKDGKLHLNRGNASWKLIFDLEHVSGDYFLAHIDSKTAPGLIFKSAAPAEFVIGSDGTPKSFGFAAAEEMGPEGRIWFERI
jgi:hypothetical protein